MEEEKKIEESSTQETLSTNTTNETEIESDFADEVKSEEPAPVEEATPEEVEPQPEVNLYKEEEVEEPLPETPNKEKAKNIPSFEYRDENLAAIENARSEFHKIYKKQNLIKWIVTGVSLLFIVLGYVIPNVTEMKNQSWSLYITLGVLLAAIIVLGVYSFISRKKIDQMMNDYFSKFYSFTNAYTFGGRGISNLQGGVADKIQPEDLRACNLYSDIVKVGSRDLISFDYHDEKIKVVDCAAQTRGQKNTLRTVFVGKMVIAPNSYDGEGIVAYLKGSKRALPPTNLAGLSVLEDHADYVVYGKKGNRKGLTKKALDIIKSIQTDKTLVDLAVSIQPGNTYFLMGYEDTLMVLPLDKPFDPAPTEHYRDDMEKVLSTIDALNGFKAE